MPIVIQPYRPEHEPAVAAFNQRMHASGERDLIFYKTATPHWLPKTAGAPIYNEYFVAVEGREVRGAYVLKHEQIYIRGKGVQSIASYHHPLSEGIVNRSYAMVGGLLVRDALQRQPLLYSLGMAGLDRPLPKMLKSLGWSLMVIPFYFRIVHPYLFLTQMEALRESPWRRRLMDVMALSGIGWLGIRAAQALSVIRSPNKDLVAEEGEEFSSWADELWIRTRDTVSASAVRNAETLKLLYPAGDQHLVRVQVLSHGAVAGWAVVGERRQDRKFGTMRVGSIVDCWASPENTLAVVRAAVSALEKRDMDLIVSNQSHSAWGRAFQRSGFLSGPSNFIFAASKKLTELLQPIEENKAGFHITRADGDGLPANF